jgi:tRNA G46 methylase TrmB
LALKKDLKPARHYLFYPNPYPKGTQLQKRWHGHPVFPTLLNLGGILEMRCNWIVYAEEFATALNVALGVAAEVERFKPDTYISAFERKYALSGQALFRVRVHLTPER